MARKKTSEVEFIALMAFLMANVAIAIDAVLPALFKVGESLNNANSTDLQLIITMIFLGLGFGQLIFGTLSDSLGRKPVVYLGVATFMLASFICIYAQSLEIMLLGRLLQGVGLSAPRTISIAIIRDSYSGDYMARIMSFVTVIFILVPMVAPLLGQLVILYYDWQMIFYFHLMFSALILIWFILRQPETLKLENKTVITRRLFINGVTEFFKYKQSVVYTIISGLITGSFMVYLSASKQIFQEQFQVTDNFVYIFAGLALLIGIATFLNGSLVVRLGMKRLSTISLYIFAGIAVVYSVVFFTTENPSLPVLLIFMSLQFACLGFIFGNVRSLAMQPVGHIAGVGSAINGFVSTIMAVPIAIFIGSFIDKTVLPMFIGFACSGLLTFLLLVYLSKKNSLEGE
jgi:DHA1 family bicyclomycin/chloramphenicol resistance-like MFS transporter